MNLLPSAQIVCARKHHESNQKYYQKNIERVTEQNKIWQQKNPELVKSYKKKYQEKNPPAARPSMTEYKRTHRKCEWAKSFHAGYLHVHHILPKYKYPEYVDGDYHGRIGNNFICFCTFHHYSYHYVYATKRNNKKHQNPTRLLWAQVSQWTDGKKISAEDLEIEISQILPAIA